MKNSRTCVWSSLMLRMILTGTDDVTVHTFERDAIVPAHLRAI